MKNIRVFLSEYFQFLNVKFSIYLNRSIFVMHPVQWCGSIQTNCKYPFDRMPHLKSGEDCSSDFRDKDI